ncbi:MAG: gliding motility-associated ABC transporter substrate-binding protein GldG [Bacteroidia bacterium]|nr:MAG: gliding motility-associated ABC transporter substrate-binding protein GldG [Bacteroidia bacterium]
MRSLFIKEISSFFSNLTGYLVIGVFMLLNSLFMWIVPGQFNVIANGYATLDSLFSISPWVFLFLVPAISMRMISEERRTGTLDLLYTRPVTELQIILAKFLASWALVLLSLLPTLIYFWSVSRLGSPPGNMDMGGTWGSYIGLLFLGGIYAAIGIFASSLTGNQIVAFIVAVFLSFLLYLGFDFLSGVAESGRIEFLVSRMGISYHYNSISRGVIDSRDILYFAGVMLLFIAGTQTVLQSSKWQSRMTRRGLKMKNLTYLGLALVLVILLGFLAEMKFFRIDLTSEKKHTLSQSSRQLLKELDDVVYVKIYLDGDLPAEFVNFRKSVRELMDEFRAYGGDKLQYEFINLYDEADETIRNRTIGDLYERGLNVTNIQVRDGEGGSSARIIFPGAMASYGEVEMPVNLLKNNPSLSHELNLNNSIQTLEYEFARAIHSLTLEEVPKIAFIEGHGELDSLQTHSLMDELKNFFQVDRGYIQGNVEVLLNYEALIVARPMQTYSEADKFALDQYIMQGGKVLFFLDPVNPFADSLSGGTTVALANAVGLEDMLFTYGIRINYNLLSDLQCNYVPVNTAPAGQQAEFTMLPWVYYPLLAGLTTHPVTRGLNYVLSQFASSLDTVSGGGEVSKTVLLATSPASRKRDVPLYISMEEVTVEPDPALYQSSQLPVGVLLEGKFVSFYKNYPVPEGVTPADWKPIHQGESTSLFVLSDGDIPANEVQFDQGAFRAQPLGYDPYTRQTFGNSEFIMNVVNYMCDETGIIELRSREFKLRLLNKEMIGQKQQLLKWKLLNTLLPLLLVLVAGVAIQAVRKRRYAL